MPKVETTLVTCDHCATDITYNHPETSRRILLKSEERTGTGQYYISDSAPSLHIPDCYFCGFDCLELWVKNL